MGRAFQPLRDLGGNHTKSDAAQPNDYPCPDGDD